MSVKICGHKVRWQKPIKIYNLTKHICVLLMLVMVCGSAAAASDITPAERCALVSPSSGIDPVGKPHPRPVAEATTLSPAHALALALGVRNIAGPMEKSAMHYSPREKKNPPASSRHAASRGSDGSSSPDECQASLVYEDRQPRLAMQR